jgi:hypothetical protein
MILQVIAIAMIVIFPQIVTTFPEHLQAESRAIITEEVDDSANRLEEDPLKRAEEEAGQEQQQEEESLEKDEMSTKKK